ncbi:signal transduction histidine kinase [Oxalobacteraceae bacterium GrIS 1.11]
MHIHSPPELFAEWEGAPSEDAAPLPSVRALLVGLVLACFLPGLIGAAALFFQEYLHAREQLQKNVTQTARAMLQAVDGRLLEARSMALALSTSATLERRDFAGFHLVARELMRSTGIGGHVTLSDRDGRQIVNTLRPFETVLPAHGKQAQQVFAGLIPTIYREPLTGVSMVRIEVPVWLAGKQAYSLGVSIPSAGLGLGGQRLPPDWVVAVFDGKGVVAARTHLPEKFVGQMGGTALLERMKYSPEGSMELVTREGIAVLCIFSSSPTSNWRVAIGIPRQSLEADLRHDVWLLGTLLAVLFCAGISFAWIMGNRISRSVRALSAAAMALGAGQGGCAGPLHFSEAAEVAASIERAAQLLGRRARSIEAILATLREREAELAKAQGIARLGSWYWDARTGAAPVSAELCRILGRESLPPFADQSGSIYAPHVWQQLNEALQRAQTSGLAYDLELPALHGDGHEIWINTRCEAVLGAAGEVIGLRGTVQDVSERVQVQALLRQSRAQLRRLLEHGESAREDERKRIARDVHDDLGQSLLALRIDLSLMRERPVEAGRAREKIDAMVVQVDACVRSVRLIINDLRPAVLNLGLHAAVEWQAEQFKQRSGIACELLIDHDEFALDDKHATALFRIVQESLVNIMKHACASRVWIHLERKQGQLFVRIVDNGIGLRAASQGKDKAFGLMGIRERIGMLGGTVSIKGEPGHGTVIVVSIPIEGSEMRVIALPLGHYAQGGIGMAK